MYVCVYVFIQDPDPGSDPKKIIPDPQHWLAGRLSWNLKVIGRGLEEKKIVFIRSLMVKPFWVYQRIILPYLKSILDQLGSWS
jgi:hypothetical protein